MFIDQIPWESLHSKNMIWFAIVLIHPLISSAFHLNPSDEWQNGKLYADGHKLEQYSLGAIEIPDIDENADKCIGRIERIRFHTGKTQGRHTFHMTMIKLNSFTTEHYTEENDLRGVLFKAYKAQSVIRIDSKSCKQSSIKFKGFSIISKGSVLKSFGKSENSLTEYSAAPNSYISKYENCYGFIENIRFLQTDSAYIEDAVSVVKLHNEPVSHYTIVPHHREILADAYFYGYEVQLLTNSCSNSEDNGFSAFRVIRTV